MVEGVEDNPFVRTLCHDIRQELALNLALLHMARQEPGLPDSAQSALDVIVRHTAEVAELIRNLVLTVPPAELDLSASVRELTELLGMVSKASIDPELDAAVVVRTDANGTRRALMNLLVNAVRAAGDGGVVRVRLRRRPGCFVLEVEDSGPGFGRATPGVASMGLSVISQWVASIGGSLELATGSDGGGLVRITASQARGRRTHEGQAS